MAATQAVDFPAKSNGKPVHYLRTTNPQNPENLAVYPTRIGTNRTNPYVHPNEFDKLATGLSSFEVRHCGVRGIPVIGGSILDPLLPPALKNLIGGFVFGTANNPGAVPAPPCRKQPKFTFHGKTSDYPQVTAEPPK